MTDVKNVALLGVTSYAFIAGGTGSGDVNEAYTISLEQGLENVGFEINREAKDAFEAHKAANEEAFVEPADAMDAMFNPFDPPELSLSEAQLADVASSADIGILTIGRNSGEFMDRTQEDFHLDDTEKEMIERASRAFQDAGKKLVVVLNIGGAIETASWKDMPDAILLAWQGGQEGGNSVADILKGSVNPSGKLPMTFPNLLGDHASHANFPEEPLEVNMMDMMSNILFGKTEPPEAEWVQNYHYTFYNEGVNVGYRHFDQADLEVSYPFGYGMSYTTFDYSDSQVEVVNDTIAVSVKVLNSGDYTGKEVVQVYVAKDSTTIERPSQELKAFTKSELLEPGESETISVQIPVSDIAYWDEVNNGWMVEPGAYSVRIGSSSRDIRITGAVSVE